MVDVVLNRASLEPLYPADGKAEDYLEALLRGLACLEEVVLRAHADLWTVPLVENGEDSALAFAEIVRSFYGTARHDVAEFFGELQRMAPADSGLADELVELLLSCQVGGPAPGLETTFPAVQAAGIEAVQCALTDGVLASLCRSDQWRCDLMGFVDPQLARSLTFDHIGTESHGLAVAERRRKQIRPRLSARNFWGLKEEYFPHLRFGRDVEGQIEAFSARFLGLAFKRLGDLDELSARVAAGSVTLCAAEKARQGIKRETAQTMQNYGEERRFRDSSGMRQTFEEHVWVDRLYRIHVFVHETPPIIEVGYVGRHLRTMEYPT